MPTDHAWIGYKQGLVDERTRSPSKQAESAAVDLICEIVSEMRSEHDRCDGHFSTAQVERAEVIAASVPVPSKQAAEGDALIERVARRIAWEVSDRGDMTRREYEEAFWREYKTEAKAAISILHQPTDNKELVQQRTLSDGRKFPSEERTDAAIANYNRQVGGKEALFYAMEEVLYQDDLTRGAGTKELVRELAEALQQRRTSNKYIPELIARANTYLGEQS